MMNYDGPSLYKNDHPKVEPLGKKPKKKETKHSKYSLPNQVRTREDIQNEAHEYMETPSRMPHRFRSTKIPTSLQPLTDWEQTKRNHKLIQEIRDRLQKDPADYLLFEEYLAEDYWVEEDPVETDLVEDVESVTEISPVEETESEVKAISVDEVNSADAGNLAAVDESVIEESVTESNSVEEPKSAVEAISEDEVDSADADNLKAGDESVTEITPVEEPKSADADNSVDEPKSVEKDTSVAEDNLVEDEYVEYREYSVEELLQKSKEKRVRKAKQKPKKRVRSRRKGQTNGELLQEKMASNLHKPNSRLHRSLSKIIAEDQDALKNRKSHLDSLFSDEK